MRVYVTVQEDTQKSQLMGAFNNRKLVDTGTSKTIDGSQNIGPSIIS